VGDGVAAAARYEISKMISNNSKHQNECTIRFQVKGQNNKTLVGIEDCCQTPTILVMYKLRGIINEGLSAEVISRDVTSRQV
jgi:hypothetical protein